METLHGFLFINKPAGITSSTCVQIIRKILGKHSTVGHAGTLDSFATGLLIIGVGRQATREMSLLLQLDKQYQATGKLGQLTDTYDKVGTILKEESVMHITHADIQNTLTSFGSAYCQIPPIYSALKHRGNNLSDLARMNRLTNEQLTTITQEKARTVNLYSLALVSSDLPFFALQTHVSHGTYIRSLIHDCGVRLRTYATTHTLERTAIGPFSLKQAVELSTLQNQEVIAQNMHSVADILTRIQEHRLL